MLMLNAGQHYCRTTNTCAPNTATGSGHRMPASQPPHVKRQAWPTAGGSVLVSWCDPDNAWRHGSRRRRLRRAATAVGATTAAATAAAATTAASAVATDATTASSTPRLRSNNGRFHLLWWGRLLGWRWGLLGWRWGLLRRRWGLLRRKRRLLRHRRRLLLRWLRRRGRPWWYEDVRRWRRNLRRLRRDRLPCRNGFDQRSEHIVLRVAVRSVAPSVARNDDAADDRVR